MLVHVRVNPAAFSAAPPTPPSSRGLSKSSFHRTSTNPCTDAHTHTHTHTAALIPTPTPTHDTHAHTPTYLHTASVQPRADRVDQGSHAEERCRSRPGCGIGRLLGTCACGSVGACGLSVGVCARVCLFVCVLFVFVFVLCVGLCCSGSVGKRSQVRVCVNTLALQCSTGC